MRRLIFYALLGAVLALLLFLFIKATAECLKANLFRHYEQIFQEEQGR